MNYYKLGCNWGPGAPDFFPLLKGKGIVIGYRGQADIKKNDVVALCHGYTVFGFGIALGDGKSVTDYPGLRNSFEEYEIGYDSNVLVAKAVIHEFAEPIYYKDRKGIHRINHPEILSQLTSRYNKYMIEKNNQILIDFFKANKNIILHGAPGTGKTYLANQIAGSITSNPDHVAFVQFHPNYDYTDFVEGLRPYKRDGQSEIGFKRMDGIFKSFCKKAVENPNQNYVFIIDEINRGDLSKIFGELFFAIDPGYRGEEGRVKTQYQNLVDEDRDENGNDDEFSGKGFYVPSNVYIIGTMNDIDRSVESMDFAMRRRFAFKEITAKESMSMLTLDGFKRVSEENAEAAFKNVAETRKRMASLNTAIIMPDYELSADYQIGAAYFLKYALYARDEMTAFDKLWDNHLKIIIKEYLRGSGDEEAKLNRLKEAYDNPEDTIDLA